MFNDEYVTISDEQSAELKVKGSLFIGTASPVATINQAQEFIQRISQKYFDATHHCYAYQLGWASSAVYRMSDAGEPSGTAGQPILSVIKGKGLTNICVIVTRYFGGTKLGKGGLARAYADCAHLVLERCTIITNYLAQRLELHFDYQLTNPVMSVLSSFQATIHRSDFDQQAHLVTSIRISQIDNFKRQLIEATSGKIRIQPVS
ncbi:MAG: YigZ family protein [candidate division KSB1 bacterium]|nr:YigZ family protein [candidate division KSB1 bacterium]MDZ7334881.1 YigZ family protein [candidate division KSB1 bacterium]MDZ7357341.1 YigZ family protein [candidate division KSB1 bacterium]MDZ7399337.1 YigZ family protein [candidate division KSB1 bacterium]